MTSLKVKCRGCYFYTGTRCQLSYRYMRPDLPRFCRGYRPKGEETLKLE